MVLPQSPSNRPITAHPQNRRTSSLLIQTAEDGRPTSPVQKAEIQPSSIPTCGILGLSIENPSHTKRTTRIEQEERERLLQLSTYSKTSKAGIEFPPAAGRPTAFRKTRRPGSERSERSMRASLCGFTLILTRVVPDTNGPGRRHEF